MARQIEPADHHRANRTALFRYVRSYALQSKGLIFHEIGGAETHVHIAVTIPPTLLISEWIGKIKGAVLTMLIMNL